MIYKSLIYFTIKTINFNFIKNEMSLRQVCKKKVMQFLIMKLLITNNSVMQRKLSILIYYEVET